MRARLTAKHFVLGLGSQTRPDARQLCQSSGLSRASKHVLNEHDYVTYRIFLPHNPCLLTSIWGLNLRLSPGLRPIIIALEKGCSLQSKKGFQARRDCPSFGFDLSQYASLLRSCGTAKGLKDGMCVHARIIQNGFNQNAFLGNLLVQMYGNCGALDEASAVFASLPYRDHFGWNFLIRSYAANWLATESLQLYERMLLEGVLPDRFILVGVLSVYASHENIAAGRLFHACIAGSGLELDPVIGTAFMNMYAKCGSLEDAWTFFNKLSEQDMVAFNAMIAAFDQSGQGMDALQLFNQMQQQAVFPGRVTFLNILSACTTEETLAEGKRLHACCVCSEFNAHFSVGTALVGMYGKCNSVEDARRTFDTMIEHDVVSWNAMITVYVQHGHIKQALQLFEEMQRQGVMPDTITFISVLDACANQGVPLDDKWIQANIKGTAAGSDVEVGTAVVNMYSKCGNLECAWETFIAVPNRNIASWNTMILAFLREGKLDSALQITEEMHQNGVVPNKFTYVAILDACATQAALEEGNWLHICIIENNFELDASVSTSIINMYSKCGRLDEAHQLFERLYERTVVSWNVVISGYVENAHDRDVLQLFQQMLHEGVMPNDVTFLCVLNACASEAAFALGKWIHSCIMGTEYVSDVVLGTAFVNMYSKCGSTPYAQRVFDGLPEKDMVLWSAMISAYVQGGQSNDASMMFNQMQEEGVIPDKVTLSSILCVFFSQEAIAQGKQIHARLVAVTNELDVVVETALICMYCKCGGLNEAWILFIEKLDRSVASWNALICGFTQSGHGSKAFQLFYQMQQEGFLPNNLTVVSILEACSSQTTLYKGHQIHAGVIHSSLSHDNKVETALVNMYAKCGSLKDAETVFHTMSIRNIVSWTVIITAYAQHGRGKDSLHLFNQMLEEGLIPNRATFVSIISACSHAGLVDEVRYFVDYMNHKTGISPGLDLYNCMVDLYGRAGRLDEAEALISTMPQDPTVVSWTTLLGACKNQVDVERGERAAKQLLRLDSHNAEPYVTLSNIYAAAGMGEEAQMVFNRMRGKGCLGGTKQQLFRD